MKIKEELDVKEKLVEELRVTLQNFSSYEIQNNELSQKVTLLENDLEYFKAELEIKGQQLMEERNFAIISSQNINELSKTVSTSGKSKRRNSHCHTSFKDYCEFLSSIFPIQSSFSTFLRNILQGLLEFPLPRSS